MRWGVRDESSDNHITTSLCMSEIKNCQRLSIGPTFVVFFLHFILLFSFKFNTNFNFNFNFNFN